MAAVAVVYLLIRTNHGGTGVVALATALQYAPLLLLKVPAGRLVDHFPRVHILQVTQSSLAAGSGGVALALAAGLPIDATLVVYSAVLGVIQVVDVAARQLIFVDLLGVDGFRAGLSLYNTIFGAGRLAAPALAGLLLSTIGAAWLFAVNTASFAFMLIGLFMVAQQTSGATTEPHQPLVTINPTSGRTRQVLNRADYLGLLLVVGLMGGLGYQFAATDTLMTSEVFHRGAAAYGALSSVLAAGGIVGNALLARTRSEPRVLHAYLLAAGFGACEILVLVAHSIWMFAVLLFPAGLSLAAFTTTALATIQLTSAESDRGRQATTYNATYIGLVPVGLLVIDGLHHAFGARSTIYLPGITIAIISLVAALWHFCRGSGSGL
jgi:MFS family permease